MKIEKDRVVHFHYAVAETGGESVENSKDNGQPLAILFGALLLGERFDSHAIGAMAVILAGVLIISRSRERVSA